MNVRIYRLYTERLATGLLTEGGGRHHVSGPEEADERPVESAKIEKGNSPCFREKLREKIFGRTESPVKIHPCEPPRFSRASAREMTRMNEQFRAASPG